jgi:hypothetical protein
MHSINATKVNRKSGRARDMQFPPAPKPLFIAGFREEHVLQRICKYSK